MALQRHTCIYRTGSCLGVVGGGQARPPGLFSSEVILSHRERDTTPAAVHGRMFGVSPNAGAVFGTKVRLGLICQGRWALP